MNNRIILILLVILVLFSAGSSQESSDIYPKIGLTALITDPHLDILVPIYLSKSMSISPAVGFTTIEDIGNDISLGVLLRFHQVKGSYSRFIGVGFASLRYKPSDENDFREVDEAQTDILLSPHIGIERYFDTTFCIGISAQLNIVQSDEHSFRVGYPDKLSTNTGTSLYATLFF